MQVKKINQSIGQILLVMLDLRSGTENKKKPASSRDENCEEEISQTVFGNSGERARGGGFPPYGSSVACSSRLA